LTKTVRIVDKPCISIEERAEMQAKFDRWLEMRKTLPALGGFF
jgi:hypothetical protein